MSNASCRRIGSSEEPRSGGKAFLRRFCEWRGVNSNLLPTDRAGNTSCNSPWTVSTPDLPCRQLKGCQQGNPDIHLACLAATATSAVIIAASAVVTAEAGDQQNPDQPVAAVIITAAAKAIVAASTEQKKKDPDAVSSKDTVISTAVVAAATARSSQITHFQCLHDLIIVYCM